jgi:antirestriction protein ArdC
LKASSVFNLFQVENYKNPKQENQLIGEVEKIKNVDDFIQNTLAKITIGGDRAYFSPSRDEIVMPDREKFIGTASSTPTEGFYSILLHELVHWSGADTRCNRTLSGKFGSEDYAMEELVAELGSAFLCAELGITNSPRQDHADYISNWISILQDNSKAIFWASARASESVKFLKEIQSQINWEK